MEETLGPEWRDLLIELYMDSAIEESDDMWQALLHELAMIAIEDHDDSDDSDEDEDSEDEDDLEEVLHHRFLLLEVREVLKKNVIFFQIGLDPLEM